MSRVNRPWFQVIAQAQGQAFGHGFPRVAGKGHQAGGLLVDAIG